MATKVCTTSTTATDLLYVTTLPCIELACVFYVVVAIGMCAHRLASSLVFVDTELVVLTGASSGLGRKTAQALLRTGDYHVIGAVRE